MKIRLLLAFFLKLSIAFAQVNSPPPIFIKGNVIEKTAINDSIYFNTGVINGKYFENTILSSDATGNNFLIKNNLTYPQMFRIVFLSDQNKRIWRFGRYFIDPSTRFIKVNYKLEECNFADGSAESEYLQKFIPFFFKEWTYSCTTNDMFNLDQNINAKFDSTLLKYVIKNPDSYVALWSLIERYSLFGQSEIRQRILNLFSENVKISKIWDILNNDFQNSIIKENKKFPKIQLKSLSLKQTKFEIPKAKFILIDYWFSRCRPCLDELPTLKKLYADYKAKGFEIVSISTDKTQDIPIWRKRVIENGLIWSQYLDENGLEATKLSITRFPTAFLLNKRGKIIRKDIQIDELKKFLQDNFKRNE